MNRPTLCANCAAGNGPCTRSSYHTPVGPCVQRVADWDAGYAAAEERVVHLLLQRAGLAVVSLKRRLLTGIATEIADGQWREKP